MKRALAAIGATSVVLAALGGCGSQQKPQPPDPGASTPGQNTTAPAPPPTAPAPSPTTPGRGPVPPDPGPMPEKPILYLYPERPVALTVELSYDGEITESYPVAATRTGGDGLTLASWNVTAEPDGRLLDAGGRAFPYLFWEGPTRAGLTQESGFVVAREDVVGFLEAKLALLGLADREAADFITYWAPRMRTNEYTLVSFDSGAYTNAARYSFTAIDGEPVEPDVFIRVFMTIRPATADTRVPEQELSPAPARAGFTAVEWGGSQL